MKEIPLIRITLKVIDKRLISDNLRLCFGMPPSAADRLDKGISASMLGHWVEIYDQRQRLIYRRRLNENIPLHIAHSSKFWTPWKTRSTRYTLDVPYLFGGHTLALYEQTLLNPNDRRPTRHCHFITDVTRSSIKGSNNALTV